MESITLLVPFVVNALILAYKGLLGMNWSGNPGHTTVLRLAAVGLSLVGVFATAWYSGNPIDVNQVSDLVKVFFETLVVFLAAHGGYSLAFAKK